MPESKPRSISLTKKRLAALNTALSLDDVLYEKFRREREYLDKLAQEIYKARRVHSVYQVVKEGTNVAMQIVDMKVTSAGTVLWVR